MPLIPAIGGGGRVEAYNAYFATTADIPNSIDFGFVPKFVYFQYQRISAGTDKLAMIYDAKVNSAKKMTWNGGASWSSAPQVWSQDASGGSVPIFTISGSVLTFTSINDVIALHVVAVPEPS